MVKAPPAKRKSNANTDFKRVKRKVGRKAPAPNTATDTSFKSRTVQVREQSVVADKGGVIVSSRSLTLPELLSKVKHHNAVVRKDALEGLNEIVEAHGTNAQVHSQLPTVITTAIEVLNDDDKPVRQATRNLLKALCEVPSLTDRQLVHWCTPFLKLTMFHVCAGLSSVRVDARLDAVYTVELLLGYFPARVAAFELQLLPLYASLLSSALAQVGSRKVTVTGRAGKTEDHSAGPVAISGRTGGIMKNFKKAQRAAKGGGKAAKTGKGAAGKAPTAAGMASAAAKGTETWVRVAEAFLRFLRNVAAVRAPACQAGSSSPSSTLSVPASLVAHRLLQRGDVTTESRGGSNAEAAVVAERQAAYAQTFPSLVALFSQCVSLNAETVRGKSVEDRARYLETLQHLFTASEIVRLAAESGAGADPAAAGQLAQLLVESFPLRNQAAATLAANEEQAIEVARLLEQVNLNVCRLALLLSAGHEAALAAASGCKAQEQEGDQDDEGNERALPPSVALRQAGPKVQALAERVVTWLASRLDTWHKEKGAENGNEAQASRQRAMADLIHVVNATLRLEALPADVRSRLHAALWGCWDRWFAALANPSADPSLRSATRLLECVAEHFGSAVHPASVPVLPEAWMVALPRIAWNACRSEHARDAARSALGILSTCAAAGAVAEPDSWAQVIRWLVPILYSQTKSTGAHLFGPFLNGLDFDLQLQALDLIAQVPSQTLPVTMLKALAMASQVLQERVAAQGASDDAAETEEGEERQEEVRRQRLLLINRAVQLPFLKFEGARKLGEDGESSVEHIANLLSFSVSLVCSSRAARSQVAAPASGPAVESEAIFCCVNQLLHQLRSVQRAHQVPVAQLAYPVLFKVLKQLVQSGTVVEEGASAGDSGLQLVKLVAAAEEGAASEDATQAEEARMEQFVLETSILRLARTVCGLHHPGGHDTFPSAFLVDIMLPVLYMGPRAADTLARLAAICGPVAAAQPVLGALSPQGGLAKAQAERLASNWGLALRLQREAPSEAELAACARALGFMEAAGDGLANAAKDVRLALADRAPLAV